MTACSTSGLTLARSKRLLVLVAFAATLLVALPAHAQTTFIDAPGRFDMVFDDARQVLYVSSGAEILRYDPAQHAFLSPITLGGDLRGVDISPDGATLAVADAAASETQTWVHLVDLATGVPRKILLPREAGEYSTHSVAFCSDGQLLASSMGPAWTPLRRIDPNTGAFIRRDNVVAPTELRPSADRSVIAFNSSRLESYVVASDSFLSAISPIYPPNNVAVDRTGARYASFERERSVFYDATLTWTSTSDTILGGLYSKSRDMMYVVQADDPTVLTLTDLITESVVATYNVGSAAMTQKGTRLAASADDRWAFCMVDGGISCIEIPLHVRGTVRSSYHGAVVPNAEVAIWRTVDEVWSQVATIAADASGNWDWTTTSTAAVRISATDPSGAHATGWHGGTDLSSATSISPVRFDPPTTDPVLQLLAPGTLEGLVRSSHEDAPLGAVRVTLYADDADSHALTSTLTAADGTFSFDGIAPSIYHLGLSDTRGGHVPEYYSDATTITAAAQVTVAAGVTTNVDFTMDAGNHFSGTVYDAATGEPLEGVSVRAYSAVAAWSGLPGLPVAAVTTDADGRWLMGNLPQEYLVLAFCDVSGTYRDMTHPNTGLPLTSAYGFDPTLWNRECDAYLVPLSSLKGGRIQRVFGTDRYQTSLAISRANFASADAVVIASGESFADALSASPLAGLKAAPVLLTPKAAVPSGLIAELKRLAPDEVIIVGGTGSVSSAVDAAIKAAGLPTPRRIAGKSRYATAGLIALECQSMAQLVQGTPFIVRGDDFADALSIGPYAYREGRPILLTRPDGFPAEAMSAWYQIMQTPTARVIVVGGEKSVSDDVLWDLVDNDFVAELEYIRLAGTDRYDTCETIIRAYGPVEYDFVAIASGQSFPDALAGGAAAGYWGGPLLLTPSGGLGADARAILAETGKYIVSGQVLGGERAVSPGTLSAARSALGTAIYDIDAPGGTITPALSSTANPCARILASLATGTSRSASTRPTGRLHERTLGMEFTTLED